jgi:hypothetical protein
MAAIISRGGGDFFVQHVLQQTLYRRTREETYLPHLIVHVQDSNLTTNDPAPISFPRPAATQTRYDPICSLPPVPIRFPFRKIEYRTMIAKYLYRNRNSAPHRHRIRFTYQALLPNSSISYTGSDAHTACPRIQDLH